MDVYGALIGEVLQPAWERVRGRTTLPRVEQLRRTQWRSADELFALQLAALRRLLHHARATVPEYRRRIDEAGLDPLRLRDLAQLRALPLLQRDQVQARREDFLSAADGRRGARERLIHKSTSGSTGRPFRFCYNHDSEVWRQAVRLRGWGWAGYTTGCRAVYYWGPPAIEPRGLKAAKIALDHALHRETYIDCARQAPGDLLRAVATLRRLRPQVMVCYTQAAVEFARFVKREGLRDWPAMRVICGAERLLPGDRVLLEEAFGAPGSVFETYGCREFMLMASECEAHVGLHESMETLLIEVVDDAGRPVPPGTPGQVAVTDLHNYGMPLIRYVNGDLAIAAPPGARCACGRGLARISSIEGRAQDVLRAPGGRTIPGMVFIALFANLGERVRQFQAIQRRDGRVDLQVVPGPEYDDGVLEGIKRRLDPYFADLPFSVQAVPEVPLLPSGKRRFVVVEGER